MLCAEELGSTLVLLYHSCKAAAPCFALVRHCHLFAAKSASLRQLTTTCFQSHQLIESVLTRPDMLVCAQGSWPGLALARKGASQNR